MMEVIYIVGTGLTIKAALIKGSNAFVEQFGEYPDCATMSSNAMRVFISARFKISEIAEINEYSVGIYGKIVKCSIDPFYPDRIIRLYNKEMPTYVSKGVVITL